MVRNIIYTIIYVMTHEKDNFDDCYIITRKINNI